MTGALRSLLDLRCATFWGSLVRQPGLGLEVSAMLKFAQFGAAHDEE